MQKVKKRRLKKAKLSSTLPVITKGNRPVMDESFPVKRFSYSMLSLFCSNPVMARVKYINNEVIETTRSSTSVLGNAIHIGLKTFLGGNEERPIFHSETDSERIKAALEAALEYIQKVPDGFIDWKASVPTREALQTLTLSSIPRYVKEWDRGGVKETLLVEQRLEEAIHLTMGNRQVTLAVPLIGDPDHVYRDSAGLIVIEDHKSTFKFSDPDAVDGAKLIQAAIYFLLVYAYLGEAPHRIVFREFKVSNNKDGSAQTREYEIVYADVPMVFDLFFRLYDDVVRLILGEAVFLPNIFATFDRDVALLTYIYRLDEPDNMEKEKRRTKVEDVAVLLQKKMVRAKNLKRFIEAKANLFTSDVSIDYKTMKHPQERIRFKLMESGVALNFVDKVEGLSVDLYRFEPTVGVRMSTVEKYHKDIEQILGVSNVRILAPIPNTEYIGFEVPKSTRKFVNLSDAKKAPALEVPFGVDIYGKRLDVDIRKMPHALVAGTTGSGKSYFLQSVLKFLSRLPQHEIRFALCDPKMVELSDFEDDKHTDFYRETPEEILDVLNHYQEEMQRRYDLFKKNKVKNIEQYREKVSKDIPYVLIVVDEFQDLIVGNHKTEIQHNEGEYMSGPRMGQQKVRIEKIDISGEIRRSILLLAAKARAAGIHLIITTQSPRTKVVDGAIKANFPVRVAFQTTSRLESEIIIDQPGAEKLLGAGDMLLSGVGNTVERLQGYNPEK